MLRGEQGVTLISTQPAVRRMRRVGDPVVRYCLCCRGVPRIARRGSSYIRVGSHTAFPNETALTEWAAILFVNGTR